MPYVRNGGSWTPVTPATGVGGGGLVSDGSPELGGNLDLNGYSVGTADAADLTKLSEITATSTELNYVDGVTSPIQSQLDNKVPTSRTVNGAALSANVTLTQDDIGDGTTYKQFSATEKTKLAAVDMGDATGADLTKLHAVTATSTELNYVDGVTSAIQTQLDAKALSSRTITGATSITGGGSLTADRTLSLVNDSAAPGNNQYYGTDGAGAKGFYAVPTGTLPTQTGNSGKYLTTNGSSPSWNTISGISPVYVNVKDYGATGNGVTDDTAAIEAAFDVSGAIYFPEATGYVYNGSGLSHSTPRILAAHKSRARILLGSSSYLINHATTYSSLNLENIDTVGGRGAIRMTYTGDAVNSLYTVKNCIFQGYTECAIAVESSDNPYWTIENCKFDGADTLNTIGVAVSGLSDMNTITRCMFIRNRIHVKIRNGGNNMHITNCDFIKFSSVNTNGPRVDIWLVPWTNSVNGGQGFSMSRCKLGNEGLAAGDYRILYADELSGTSNGTRMPNLAADSTGFVMGHQLDHFMVNGKSGAAVPIIYSTTPNVRDLQLGDVEIAGTKPTYAIEFRTPSGVVADRLNSQNLFGPFNGQLSTEGSAAFPISNVAGVGYVNDPNYAMATLRETLVPAASPFSSSYFNLLPTTIANFSLTGATKANTTDAYGGANAQAITFTSTSGVAFAGISTMTIWKPIWVSFDVKAPASGTAMTRVKVYVRDNGGNFHWVRTVDVPSHAQGWKTYRFPFTPRTAGSTPRLYFAHNGVDATNITVEIGDVRVYHSYEPVVGVVSPIVAYTDPPQIDLATNGTLEAASTGWSAIPGAGGTASGTRSTSAPHAGTYGFRVSHSVSSTFEGGAQYDLTGITSGVPNQVTVWVRCTSTKNWQLRVLYRNSGSTVIETDASANVSATSNTWTQLSLATTCAATGAVSATVQALVPDAGIAAGTNSDFDDLTFLTYDLNASVVRPPVPVAVFVGGTIQPPTMQSGDVWLREA